jgi:uncharacterized membrane protein
VRGIFSPTSILGKFTSKIRGIFAIIGKALGFVSKLSGLTAFLKLGLSLGKAIPIVGQIIMVLTGIFGFITGAIKGFKTGGILGAIKGGLIGLYDGLIGSFLNLIADIIGWVFKKLGFEKVGEFFGNLDFSFAGIMNGIAWVWDTIKGVFHNLVNNMKEGANFFIKLANLVPGVNFDLFDTSPYVSTYEPMKDTGGKTKLSDVPSLGDDTARVDTSMEDVNLEQLRKVDYSNTMNPGDINAVFADQGDAVITVSDEELNKRHAALIAANQMDTDAAGDAMIAAEVKKQMLVDEKLLQELESGNTAPFIVNDNSSKSQMNNTQMVSTGLSVDATDLVAAKLNMMLPSFN